MKLTKFGILVNKTTYLFTSIRDSNNSRGCAKIWVIQEGKGGKFWGPILENPEGRGCHMAKPFHGGGMDICWNHTLNFLTGVSILENWESIIGTCRGREGWKGVCKCADPSWFINQICPSIFTLNWKSGQKYFNIVNTQSPKSMPKKLMNLQSTAIAGSGNLLKSHLESKIWAKIFSKLANPFAYSPSSLQFKNVESSLESRGLRHEWLSTNL